MKYAMDTNNMGDRDMDSSTIYSTYIYICIKSNCWDISVCVCTLIFNSCFLKQSHGHICIWKCIHICMYIHIIIQNTKHCGGPVYVDIHGHVYKWIEGPLLICVTRFVLPCFTMPYLIWSSHATLDFQGIHLVRLLHLGDFHCSM